MTRSVRMNELEKQYFFERKTGTASDVGYIDNKTWRGFQSSPKIAGLPSKRLRDVFYYLADRLDEFYGLNRDRTPSDFRIAFDRFHAIEIEYIFKAITSKSSDNAEVYPLASGTYKGIHAYNSFAKVLNLAHTHWCFRPNPKNESTRYNPSEHPLLRLAIHVPIDSKVLEGVSRLIAQKLTSTPDFDWPIGGMGCVKSFELYTRIQKYFRDQVDEIDSTTFRCSKVSPLAFEAFWEASEI